MDPTLFQMIQEAAYYKWLSYDGCVDSQTCWLQAEEEILKLNTGQRRADRIIPEPCLDFIFLELNEI